MSTVDRAGCRLAYSDEGAGPPALLLLHGWCGDRSALVPLARAIGPGHRVLNADLRGFGQSRFAGVFGSAEVTADLVAVLGAANVTRPVVIGHSLGGRFALDLVRRHPGIPAALVLLDSAIVETAERQAARRTELDRPDWAELLATRFRGLVAGGADPASAEAILAVAASVPLAVARASLAAGDGVDTEAALAGCRIPVLYVAAERPRETLETLTALNPDIEYVQIPNTGHFVQADAPNAVAALILEFAARRVPGVEA